MRVAAVQSSFIPWRGYFDIIASVDIFVFLDDVQYTVRDWRNRNKIKTRRGVEWLTVPVIHEKREQRVDASQIMYEGNWQKKMVARWLDSYQMAPFCKEAYCFLSAIEDATHRTISQLNIAIIREICQYLNINTRLIVSSDIDLQGAKTDRIIDMLKKLNASSYLSGPSADEYLDKECFRQNKISLEYKSYDYESYPQLWGEFVGEVSILDLIANCGYDSRNYIRSLKCDKVIIA